MFTYKADSTEQILSCNWKPLQSKKPFRYNMSQQQMLPENLQYHLLLLSDFYLQGQILFNFSKLLLLLLSLHVLAHYHVQYAVIVQK